MKSAGRIVVLGGGESGAGAALLAKKLGYIVFVSDAGKIADKYRNVLINNNIGWEESRHSRNIILDADEIIKSPGIPDNVEIIRMAKDNNIPVISEIEFAGRFTKAKKICVTGSNGKTTTANMVYHILKKAGLDVCLAGNVGESFAFKLAQRDYEYFVLEISSFQLDNMYEFKSDVAILLNITPDHMDRYDNDFEKYCNSKFRIIQNQKAGDYFIYNADDPVIIEKLDTIKTGAKCLPFSQKVFLEEGACIDNNKIKFKINNKEFYMNLADLSLKGKHNTYNSMASGITARLFDIRKVIIKESLSDFRNVEHRLETVSVVRGIEFINDSKATNINSTWFALESMTKPIVWIVGGIDKGNDYSELKELVKQKVKAIICLGEDNSRIIDAFRDEVSDIVETVSAKDAVKTAYSIGKPGDVVLLSPACASFDLFENFEDRGNKFKQAVYDL